MSSSSSESEAEAPVQEEDSVKSQTESDDSSQDDETSDVLEEEPSNMAKVDYSQLNHISLLLCQLEEAASDTRYSVLSTQTVHKESGIKLHNSKRRDLWVFC